MIINHVRLVKELSGGIETDNGSVLIEHGKIQAVSALPADLSATQEEQIIDGKGHTLLPGLIDLHTHITVLNQIGFDCMHSDFQLLSVAAKHACEYLDMGFTTIRDCGSIHRVANEVKHMIQMGLIDGPDLITCGKALMPTQGDKNHMMAQHVHFANTTDEIRKAVREEGAQGADFIKIFASGAAAVATSVPQQSIMFPDEIEEAVKTAKRNGHYVAAHCHADDAIRNSILAGVETIEHATLISEETLKLAIERNVKLIPTLAVMYVSDGPNKSYWEQRLGPMFSHCTKMMKKAYQAGLKLGFGTDCSARDFAYKTGVEFKFRKENCGMKDLDILLQCTKHNAVFAGIDKKVGEVTEGLDADLILVNGQPDQDIYCLCKVPEMVIKKGKIVRG